MKTIEKKIEKIIIKEHYSGVSQGLRFAHRNGITHVVDASGFVNNKHFEIIKGDKGIGITELE